MPVAESKERSLLGKVWKLPVAVLLVATWCLSAALLWQSTTLPDGLKLPSVDVTEYFTASELTRMQDYTLYSFIVAITGILFTVGALLVYVKSYKRFLKESAAGRVGTGVFIALVGTIYVWIVTLPFQLLSFWLAKKYDLINLGYIDYLVGTFDGLSVEFISVAFLFATVMGFSRRLKRAWWIPVTVIVVAITALLTFIGAGWSGTDNTDSLSAYNSRLSLQVEQLRDQMGVGDIPVKVEEVSDSINAPNAFATGIGSTRKVFLWDTLLDGRFTDAEVEQVVAHEFSHHKYSHLAKGIAWTVLFLAPMLYLLSRLVRRKEGVFSPHAVPIFLLLFTVITLVASPLENVVSRQAELEADWGGLNATRNPEAATELEVGLSRESVSDPDGPYLDYLLFATHPTAAQRIALVKEWQKRDQKSQTQPYRK